MERMRILLAAIFLIMIGISFLQAGCTLSIGNAPAPVYAPSPVYTAPPPEPGPPPWAFAKSIVTLAPVGFATRD